MNNDQDIHKNKSRSGMRIFGEFSFWFGLLFGILGSFGLVTDIDDRGSYFLAWIIMGPLPFAFGFWARKKGKKLQSEMLNNEIETKILKLAQKKKGCLTSTEVSVELGLSISESRFALDNLAIKGVAVPEAGNEGGVYYIFIELIEKG